MLLNHARTAVSIFAFLLAVLLVVAGREMFGDLAALFALTLFVFDPLMVAHGPLLGTDVGATCCIFATVYALYRYVKRPSLLRLSVCAVATGLSLATKHSAILVVPILILLAMIEVAVDRPLAAPGSANPQPGQGRARSALRLAASLLVIFAVSVTILWAFYGFRYQARPGGAQIAPPTAVYLSGLHNPAEAKAIGFAETHHLLPEAYLYGFTDVTMLSRDGRVMYLFGRMFPEGRWFYFPAAFLIKSTVGFLLLLLLVPFSKVTLAERCTPRGVAPCHSSGHLHRRSADLEARHRHQARDAGNAVSAGAGGGECGQPGTAVASVGLGSVDPAGAACGFVAAHFSELPAVLE